MGISMYATIAALLTFTLFGETALGCTIQNGISYKGTVLTTLPFISSADVCCFECRSNPDCIAFTFSVNGTDANKCVLRTDVSSTLSDVKAISGISTGVCSFEDGVEYPLFTSQVVTNIPNKETCCYWCSTTLKCAAFTYFKSSKQCVLKYAVANRVLSPNLSSGVVIAGSAGACTFEDGFKYSGFDLRALSNVPTKAACCAACRGTPPCAAFSYSRTGPAAKTCTLKSATVNKIANPDAVSAVVTGLSCMDIATVRK